jgi:Tfp pilus assembly protein PilV
MYARHRQHGLTLIELIVFIVIVSVALAGVLSVLNLTARSSADPMIRKQMLAIAEGLMDEVAAQPFTWCDPDDPAAATAINAAACATQEVTAPGAPEAGETRGGRCYAFFDNVNDYGCGPGVVACNLASPTKHHRLTATRRATVPCITVVQSALGPAANPGPGHRFAAHHRNGQLRRRSDRRRRLSHALRAELTAMTPAVTRRLPRRTAGFTLIEAIIAIVITGILGAVVAVFISKPIQGYFDSVRRAELTDQADVALRRISARHPPGAAQQPARHGTTATQPVRWEPTSSSS